MLNRMAIGAVMGSICATSGYLIASQIPQFSDLWWAGYAGAAGGLGFGLLAFLGGCIGYIMGRASRQSAKQLEHVTRFWRAPTSACWRSCRSRSRSTSPSLDVDVMMDEPPSRRS